MINGDGTTDLPTALDRALSDAGPDKAALHSLCVTGHLADDGRHRLAVWAWWHWAQENEDARLGRLARAVLVELHEISIDRFDLALAWIERTPAQKVELIWSGPFEPDLLADRWRVSHRALMSRGARVAGCTYTVREPDDPRDTEPRERSEGSCEVRISLQSSSTPSRASIATTVLLGVLPFSASVPLRARFDAIVAELGLAEVATVEVISGIPS